MATLKLIIAGILALGQILAPIGGWIAAGGEKGFRYEWNETDEFTADSYIELKKAPGEDFVILNLADIQLEDSDLYKATGVDSLALIPQLVEDTNPDLITLSGDNGWGTIAYLEIIELVDSFGIPWAAVMGNHDGEGCMNEFWAAYHLANAENSLFEFGPEDMGYGNYIINITENDKIIHSIYMLDTHADAEYEIDGETKEGYDHLWDNQIKWYEWGVKGTNALAGYPVQSTVIMHIPVVEYYEAWHTVAMNIDEANGKLGEINPIFSAIASGRRGEYGGLPPVNNGFFDKAKELGSTKNMLAGHDHDNDYSIFFEGIRLTYVVKTGYGCYYTEDMLGATTININSLGIADVNQNYYQFADGIWSAVAE